MRGLLLLTMLAGLLACDYLPSREEGKDTADSDAEVVAVYERRLVMLGGDEDEYYAVVFDFQVTDQGTRLQRSARGWVGRDLNLEAVFSLHWGMEPMRDPWRLVPYGPLRLLIEDGADSETLLYREEEREYRLVTGNEIARWSPDLHNLFMLRGAELHWAGDVYSGIMLDLQASKQGRPATVEPGMPEQEPALSPSSDTTEEFYLTDGYGLSLVLSARPNGADAWLRQATEDRHWTDVAIEWLDRQEYEPARREVPNRWWLESPDDALRGQVTAETSDFALLEEGAQPAIVGVILVRGWLEVDGERRGVFGAVRHEQR